MADLCVFQSRWRMSLWDSLRLHVWLNAAILSSCVRACVCVKASALKLCFCYVFCLCSLPLQPEPIDCVPAGRPSAAASCQRLEWAGGWMDYSFVSWGTLREISHYVKLKPLIRKTTAGKLCKPIVFFCICFFFLHFLFFFTFFCFSAIFCIFLHVECFIWQLPLIEKKILSH